MGSAELAAGGVVCLPVLLPAAVVYGAARVCLAGVVWAIRRRRGTALGGDGGGLEAELLDSL